MLAKLLFMSHIFFLNRLPQGFHILIVSVVVCQEKSAQSLAAIGTDI